MILCDECGVRPAAVHVTAIVNGDKHDINLCEECAGKRKEFALHLGALAEKLAQMRQQRDNANPEAQGEAPKEELPLITCPQCGTTWAMCRRKGRVGCAQCYDAFRQPLARWLGEKTGAAMYVGQRCDRAAGTMAQRMQLTRLKSAQKEAVANEQYELAAQLRDQIHALKEALEVGQDE